jgi:hypothetical protein
VGVGIDCTVQTRLMIDRYYEKNTTSARIGKL